MGFSAVIVAAGVGVRAGPGEAKQWRTLAGRPVVRWSAEALLAAGADELVVVVADGQQDRAREALAGLAGWRLAAGGAARSEFGEGGAGGAARPRTMRSCWCTMRPARWCGASMSSGWLRRWQPRRAAILALPLADTLKRDDGSAMRRASPRRRPAPGSGGRRRRRLSGSAR